MYFCIATHLNEILFNPIIAITALRGALTKAVLLVGSGIYSYRTSVFQRVCLALNSMIQDHAVYNCVPKKNFLLR